MFTLDQIKEAHSKVKSGADFPAYIQEIKQLGVRSYETFVNDGHANFYGENAFRISSLAKYPALGVSDRSNAEQFILDLKAHQQGKTDFLTFCKDCANSGIEKWEVDLSKMNCTYFDQAGNEMLVELVPTAK